MNVEKKIINHFAEICFSVFESAVLAPPNTLKLFLAKCFIIFSTGKWHFQSIGPLGRCFVFCTTC